MVPHEATVLMAPDRAPAPATEARTTVAQSGQLARGGATRPRQGELRVQRGDTLASIARLFKTTVASLKSWNPRFAAPADWPAALTVYRSRTERSEATDAGCQPTVSVVRAGRRHR
jgi:hypothetical protein